MFLIFLELERKREGGKKTEGGREKGKMGIYDSII